MSILLFVFAFAGAYLTALQFVSSGKGKVHISRKKSIYERLTNLIPMSVYEEKRIKAELFRLDINISPKMFKARAVVPAAALVAVGAATLPCVPFIGAASAALGIAVYFQKMSELTEKIKKRNAGIVRELPRFVRTFIHGMEYEKDVITILEKYLRVAGKDLKKELNLLVSDMKTENAERALQRFDAALSIPQMTSFVSALTAAMRGEDQYAALRSIASEMQTLARENIRAELQKRPGKVRAACLPMVLAMLGMYLYVLGINLFQSLNVMM